ncbi:MAG: GDSL-type esterase/lipase family protein, partial [Bdellovibrionaceae bacterium]|nr:GDSL-type esterase/lipase family protein [Pseudobdellovibrionaceae bacterium]
MKMRSLIPILASLLLSSPGFAKEKILLILGDSLTEGYGVAREAAFPALLEKKLQSLPQKWKVINSGVSGSTTASAKSRLLWALKANPDVILIALGANDGLRGLKTSASEENLRQAIREAKKQKIKVVLGGIYMPPNYGKSYTTEFRNMYL